VAEVGAVVVCGGRSSRMGRPKALLPWRGRSLIEHVVEVLSGVVEDIVVVTSDDLMLPPLAARVLIDEEPEQGPLEALAVGLAAVQAPLAYATATDVPFLSRDLVRAVLDAGGAAAPVVDGFVQTLAAAYPTAEGALAARRLLASGRRRPLELLEALAYQPLEPAQLPGLRGARGLNTPAEFLEAVREDEPGATASLEFVGRPRALCGVDALRVPVGTLASVLARAPEPLALCEGEQVSRPYLVSLGGRDFVRDGRLPVGAGERVVVLDAAAGG